MNFLHCLTDDKFIDDIIDVFEHIKGNHHATYTIVSSNSTKIYTLIKRNQNKIIHIDPENFIDYVVEHKINVVILHSFGVIPYNVTRIIPQNIKVVWKAWGADLYRTPSDFTPLVYIPLYHTYTQREILKDIPSNWQRIKSQIYYFFHKKEYQEAISRVDFFSGVLPEEYDLINQKKHFYFKAKKIYYPYFSLNLKNNKDNFIDLGENIVLGNSAAFPNNHIDILNILRNIKTKNKHIIIPFSYQRNEKYVRAVKKYAKKYFGDKVVFLESFIPLPKYQKILESCNYAIYGNEQQAAIGNISDSIYCGRKVFLSRTSLVYKHYKALGYKVFTIQNDMTATSLSQPLSIQEKTMNRELYIKHSSIEQSLSFCYNMLIQIEKNYD